VSLNLAFYLVPARNPGATYEVLWYRFIDTGSCLKVDLLFPGVLNIPSIPASSITTTNSHRLPCAPLLLVLLLKLQAWIHHGEALEFRYRQKKPTDARDILVLLPIACSMNIHLRSESYLPKSFVDVSKSRAEKFAMEQPDARKFWESLGFVEKVVVVQASRRVNRTSVGRPAGTKLSTTSPRLRTAVARTYTDDDLEGALRRLRLAEWD